MSEDPSKGDKDGAERELPDIYKLTKPELIQQLRDRVSITALVESLSVDVLRKQLSKVSKRQRKLDHAPSTSSTGEKKPNQTASSETTVERERVRQRQYHEYRHS